MKEPKLAQKKKHKKLSSDERIRIRNALYNSYYWPVLKLPYGNMMWKSDKELIEEYN